MLQTVENYLNNLNGEKKAEVKNDLLNDILYLTKEVKTDYLFCDLRGDVDVVEDLTETLNQLNINKIYYPVDQMNCEYDLDEFEKNGWKKTDEKLVGEYDSEVVVLEK